MMIEMMDFLLSLLIVDWIMKDTSPEVIRRILVGGAILLVIGIAITSGSVICYIALAIVAGIVGLAIFHGTE